MNFSSPTRSSRRLNSRWWLQAILIVALLFLTFAPAGATTVVASTAVPSAPVPPDASPEEARTLEDVESSYQAGYLDLATGDPLAVPATEAGKGLQQGETAVATHATYAWPFNISLTMGHAIQSYQNYGSTAADAYFHHGIDMMVPNGTQVYNRSGGQVVNVENYQPGNALYWEVAVKDPEGYIWQYHHIDNTTIPQAIKDKFNEYKANPTTGGFIPANTYIGNVVYWTVVSYNKRFNHIHLNILAAGGAYVNPMEFHTPLNDTSAPQIQAIGLLKNDAVQTGTSVTPPYGLYARARDLMLDDVYWLPPYKVNVSIDGGAAYTVWEFKNLPGGANDKTYVNDYYVVPPTCGNYSCRDFYIDLGFTTAGQRAFTTVNGSHTVNITAYDYAGNSASGSYTWTVTGGTSNQPPSANPQSVTIPEDTATVVTLTGSDPEGKALTYAVATQPGHGSLTGAAPNLTYTPAANYNGPDSFTFTVNDGASNSSPAAVSIAVTPVNDPPTANAQSVATETNAPAPVTLTGSDIDGDALTYTVATPPTSGSLSGAAPNLTYTPLADYVGSDSFTFTVSDGQAASSPATVSVTVTPPNNPPTADPQSLATAEDTPLAVTLSGSDPDGQSLTYVVATLPAHGTLSGTAPNLTYTPAANYYGADSFTFTVSDGNATSAPATVDITITAVNDPPVANAQSVTTAFNSSVAITLTGSDVEGSALTFAVATGPAHGTLSGAAPSLTYTPVSGFSGADSFTFVANDGQAASGPATVSISVTQPALYLGSAASGTAGGVSFADEDILIKNQATGAWTMYIDGSDIGLTNTDVDAFEVLGDGSLLFSFDTDFTLSGFGAVDDADLLRFVPTSTGATTAGSWQWYFDGSDVGLSTTGEDVDALAVLPDGRLVMSTLDTFSVTGVSGQDEDLLAFTPSQLGSTTSGSWAMYFDGSDVGLADTTNEDINAIDVDATGKIYISTLGTFSVTGVSGDGSDIIVCRASSLGNTTACSWAMYWDGSVNGFSGQDTDALGLVQ